VIEHRSGQDKQGERRQGGSKSSHSDPPMDRTGRVLEGAPSAAQRHLGALTGNFAARRSASRFRTRHAGPPALSTTFTSDEDDMRKICGDRAVIVKL